VYVQLLTGVTWMASNVFVVMSVVPVIDDMIDGKFSKMHPFDRLLNNQHKTFNLRRFK
jgi:hypothetical protein